MLGLFLNVFENENYIGNHLLHYFVPYDKKAKNMFVHFLVTTLQDLELIYTISTKPYLTIEVLDLQISLFIPQIYQERTVFNSSFDSATLFRTTKYPHRM